MQIKAPVLPQYKPSSSEQFANLDAEISIEDESKNENELSDNNKTTTTTSFDEEEYWDAHIKAPVLPPYKPSSREQFADVDAEIGFINDVFKSKDKNIQPLLFGYDPYNQQETEIHLQSLRRKTIKSLNKVKFETANSEQFNDANAV